MLTTAGCISQSNIGDARRHESRFPWAPTSCPRIPAKLSVHCAAIPISHRLITRIDRVTVEFELRGSTDQNPHSGVAEMSPDIPALPGFNLTTVVFLSPHGGSSDSCKGGLDSLCEWKRLVLRGRYRHRGICRHRSKPSRVRGEAKALGWAYFREPGLNAVIEVVLKTRGPFNFGEYISSDTAQQRREL
jgi:hypothetical protein